MNEGFARRVSAAVRSVPLQAGERPAVGVILGSGLGSFVDTVAGREVPYRRIRGFPQPTVEGHRGLLKLSGSTVVASGRFHYYEGWSMDDVVLPVFLLHGLGVRTLVITNAAGGINRDYQAGELVLIRDHINLMGLNPLRGPNPEGSGPRFPDMSQAYSRELRQVAQQAAGKPLHEGVYAAFSGPTYETPAEVRMAERLGADLVGMSTVPEVIACSHLGIRVLGISCVTNMAAGILERPLSHQEVMQTAGRIAPAFARLVSEILRRLEA
jgi:purine-nucleoside phosphorylase